MDLLWMSFDVVPAIVPSRYRRFLWVVIHHQEDQPVIAACRWSTKERMIGSLLVRKSPIVKQLPRNSMKILIDKSILY
jgi:hypothetical protein